MFTNDYEDVVGRLSWRNVKSQTAEEIRELIKIMIQNDYDPRINEEAVQQGKRDITFEEKLLSRNKLLENR